MAPTTNDPTISKLHRRILDSVRDHAPMFDEVPDLKLLRMIFANFRAGNGRTCGLRLSNIGRELVSSCFHGVIFKMPSGYVPTRDHVLFFDRNSRLPWYLSPQMIVVFDTDIAVKLRLADGDLDSLLNQFD